MKLTKQNFNEILKNWEIGNIKKIKRAKEGAVNYNWRINSSKGEFILRMLNNSYKKKEIEFEMDYLNNLKKEGFKYNIPTPIKTKTNKNFLIIEKNFFWLYPFIKGIHRKTSSKKELSEIAKMVSIFHNFLEKANLKNGKSPQKDFGRKGIINEMEEFLKKIPKNPNKRDQIFSKKSKEMIKIFKSLDVKMYNSLKKYPIHRDLNPQNLLWKGSKLVGILDFENVGRINDVLIRDLSVLIQYFCSNKEKSFNLEKSGFLIKEYSKYHPILPEEISVLIDSLIATNIEDFGYAYWLLINTPKRAKIRHLTKYTKMTKYLFKNREKIVEGLVGS